jgi:hypothetical protein
MQRSADFDGVRQDFRQVDVARVVWHKTHRGASASMDTPGQPKIMVQTPVVRCRVQPMASTYSSGWTITLLFDNIDNSDETEETADDSTEAQDNDDDDVQTEFLEFLSKLQTSCAEWGGLNHLALSDSVYYARSMYADHRCTFRVTAFSDALFFDADASQVQSPAAMAACSCVLQLQGAWTTAEKWGLRWKVVQVKAAAAPQLPATVATVATVAPRPPVAQECMF